MKKKQKQKNSIHIFQLDENFSPWPFKVGLGRSSKAWVKGETRKKLLVDDTFGLELEIWHTQRSYRP